MPSSCESIMRKSIIRFPPTRFNSTWFLRYTQILMSRQAGELPSLRMTAIYPGSFDPLTNGHLDIIARASRLVDHLVVAILQNFQKEPLFSVEERAEMLLESTSNIANCAVDSF